MAIDLNEDFSGHPAGQTTAARPAYVRIWDIPTRLFHWMVVLLVLTSWLSVNEGLMTLHLWSGSILMTLLIFRIVWGLVGSTTARFSNFLAPPSKVFGYLGSLAKGEKLLHSGHNPAGGWMVLALILVLVAQVSLGLFANDGMHFNGPLATYVNQETSDRLTELHSGAFNLVLLLTWIHVVAVFFYLCVNGENLILPMISGRKRCEQSPPSQHLRLTNLKRAFWVLAASAGVVWWIVQR